MAGNEATGEYGHDDKPGGMAEEYACAHCGETYKKGWSEKEATAEAKANWGDLPDDDKAVVCDDCFKKFMAWHDQTAKTQQ